MSSDTQQRQDTSGFALLTRKARELTHDEGTQGEERIPEKEPPKQAEQRGQEAGRQDAEGDTQVQAAQAGETGCTLQAEGSKTVTVPYTPTGPQDAWHDCYRAYGRRLDHIADLIQARAEAAHRLLMAGQDMALLVRAEIGDTKELDEWTEAAQEMEGLLS